jgi:predicted RNA-binding Zn-ribbon protein involved in translation (DUF1610 family)
MATSAPCPRCGAATTTRPVPVPAHQLAEVTVEVRGLAVSTCAAGHQDVRPSQPLDHCRRAIDDQVLHAGRRPLRRGSACGSCGASLDLPPRTTEVPVPFDADGVVVTVVLRAPLVRCPSCGEQQVTREIADLVDRALQASIDAAGSASSGGS